MHFCAWSLDSADSEGIQGVLCQKLNYGAHFLVSVLTLGVHELVLAVNLEESTKLLQSRTK